MGTVSYITDQIGTWRELFRHHDEVNGSTLTIYVNDAAKAIDVVQTNDAGESITTHMKSDLDVMQFLKDAKK